MKTFAEITKKFLKDNDIIDNMIKCAYIHYVEYMFNDIPYKHEDHKHIILKQKYSSDEWKTFWKEMEFEPYGDKVIISAIIWLIDNDFVHFDILRDGEWKYIIVPKIPEICKRSRK